MFSIVVLFIFVCVVLLDRLAFVITCDFI